MKTSYNSTAEVVNSISSLIDVVVIPFGFGVFTGAGVAGFEIAGVPVTEPEGVEFSDGLYTSLP
jgi:hypothetical protein